MVYPTLTLVIKKLDIHQFDTETALQGVERADIPRADSAHLS